MVNSAAADGRFAFGCSLQLSQQSSPLAGWFPVAPQKGWWVDGWAKWWVGAALLSCDVRLLARQPQWVSSLLIVQILFWKKSFLQPARRSRVIARIILLPCLLRRATAAAARSLRRYCSYACYEPQIWNSCIIDRNNVLGQIASEEKFHSLKVD